VTLVQVVHVTGAESVAQAVAYAEHADALLLDSGNPALAVKELGGTGRAHDWSISREIWQAA
jgi:phosphoribosylanthranilate isomerase